MSGQLYATAALLGSFCYGSLRSFETPEIPAALISCTAAFLLRAAAITFDIMMGPPTQFIRIGKVDHDHHTDSK